MAPGRILGIVLLVIGVLLLLFGLNATGSFGERVMEGVTGRYSNATMWYIIGGAVLAIVGAALTFFGTNRHLKA